MAGPEPRLQPRLSRMAPDGLFAHRASHSPCSKGVKAARRFRAEAGREGGRPRCKNTMGRCPALARTQARPRPSISSSLVFGARRNRPGWAVYRLAQDAGRTRARLMRSPRRSDENGESPASVAEPRPAFSRRMPEVTPCGLTKTHKNKTPPRRVRLCFHFVHHRALPRQRDFVLAVLAAAP